MSVPLYIPFNHQPANRNSHTSTYTVPSGYYARVTVLLATSVNFSLGVVSSATVTFGTNQINTDSNSESFEFWMTEGQTVTASAGGGTVTSNISGATATIDKSLTGSASCSVNGNTFTIKSSGSFLINATVGAGGNYNFNLTESGSSLIIYEEYLIPS